MPRIELLSPDSMSPEQLRVHDSIVRGPRGRIQGPLRAALHNPELAERWSAFGELLRYRTSLTRRQCELAILVTGRHCQSAFEWYAHRLEAERAGINAETIEALLRQVEPTGLDAVEEVVVRFARELNALKSVSDATYADALRLLGTTTVVELTALIGYYTMVAMTLNAHEIPLPDGVTPAFALPQESLR